MGEKQEKQDNPNIVEPPPKKIDPELAKRVELAGKPRSKKID